MILAETSIWFKNWGRRGLGLKIVGVLGPSLKTGSVVGSKNLTDEGRQHRNEGTTHRIFI